MFGIFGKKKEKKDTAADRQKNAASDTCTLCGQPLDSRSTFLLKRQKVCKACYQKSKPDIFCSACGREGPLYSWEGKQYCSSCYRSLVRANACGLCWKVLEKGEKTWSSGISGDNRLYCEACYRQIRERNIVTMEQLHTLPRMMSRYQEAKDTRPCRICGKIEWTGRLMQAGDHPNAVCEECFSKYIRNPDAPDGIPPVSIQESTIMLDSKAIRAWFLLNPQFRIRRAILLSGQSPVIHLSEDGANIRDYLLETDPDMDLSGTYFHVLAALTLSGLYHEPLLQVSGVISSSPEAKDTVAWDDIIYRFEVYIPTAGKHAEEYRRLLEGASLEEKALFFRGSSTHGNVILLGICSSCRRSFAFRTLDFAALEALPAYSDDGLDVAAFSVAESRLAAEDPRWSAAFGEKQFRFANPFRCPHCGHPYLDYLKYPRIHHIGEPACLLTGHQIMNQEFYQEQ